jgi:hypothetical protein
MTWNGSSTRSARADPPAGESACGAPKVVKRGVKYRRGPASGGLRRWWRTKWRGRRVGSQILRDRRRSASTVADGRGSGSFGGVITGVFLADAAAVVDNKLNVSGGVLSSFMVGPDRQAQFVLVVLSQTETDCPVRQVEVEIRPPTDDDPLIIEYELPDAAAGGEIGFAFFNIEVRLPVNGRWVFVVTGGAGVFSLPLQVSG